jgi:N-acetylmuramoyl-L-alanine amidase
MLSPNRDARPAGCRPDCVILHYTGMLTAAAAAARLRDPAAKVSAHYLIDEAGAVVALVPEAERAWHAGLSHWAGRERLNDVSIGIELANPGHSFGYRPFPPEQLRALIGLVAAIRERWAIPAAAILAHSDVAPERKQDPGERLDWPALALSGIGVWPAEPRPCAPDHDHAAGLLALIGYRRPAGPAQLGCAVAAFQRRFRAARVDGRVDRETMGRLIATAPLFAAHQAPS